MTDIEKGHLQIRVTSAISLTDQDGRISQVNLFN